MYLRIKGKQKEIINSAVKKAGSYRKLQNALEIPKASLYRYKKLEAMPEKRFQKLIKFIELKETLEIEKFEDNWKQILGGKNCVKSKKEKGSFEKQLRKAQKSGAKKLKKWHKKMKLENPTEYYTLQYEKFKKIYGYKYKTKNNEMVRNKFEKDVANKLKELSIKYIYEPLINIDKRWFYPDFVIENKIIIEATEWQGDTKAYQLKEKLKHLKKKFKVFVVIPKHLYTKYKILNKDLILGVENLDSVAQWLEHTAVK